MNFPLFIILCITQQKFEDTNAVIRSRKSKDRQLDDQKKKDNDLQNTTHKTKDRATRTQLKIGGELVYSGEVAVPAPLVASVLLL